MLFDKVSNWKTFIAIFFWFNVLQAIIESYVDYDLFRNYDLQVAKAQAFYQGVEFVNAKYLFNFIVFRELNRGFVMAGDLLSLGVICAEIKEFAIL